MKQMLTARSGQVVEFMFNGVISLGLLLGTGMTPNGVDFSFFTCLFSFLSFFHV